jgi:hypothetical protein
LNEKLTSRGITMVTDVTRNERLNAFMTNVLFAANELKEPHRATGFVGSKSH